MARIVHPDTYTCDMCGIEMEQNVVHHRSLPVLFLTEQNEGRPVKPYITTQEIDLCPDCLDRCTVIEADGAMWVNDYRWREDRCRN